MKTMGVDPRVDLRNWILLGGAGLLVASRFPIGEKDHEERLAILAERASHIAPLPHFSSLFSQPSPSISPPTMSANF